MDVVFDSFLMTSLSRLSYIKTLQVQENDLLLRRRLTGEEQEQRCQYDNKTFSQSSVPPCAADDAAVDCVDRQKGFLFIGVENSDPAIQIAGAIAKKIPRRD